MEKINSFYSNVNICAEKRQGKTGKHYMDAHTHCRTYINSEAKYTRTIYVDLDLMKVNSSTFEKCSPGYQNEIRSRLQKETPVYIKKICPDLY